MKFAQTLHLFFFKPHLGLFCLLLLVFCIDNVYVYAEVPKVGDSRPTTCSASRNLYTVNECDMSDYTETRTPQPYIRNSMARAMYNKMMEDERDRQSDHYYWYTVNSKRMPEAYRHLFKQMTQDDDTQVFLQNCYDKSEALFMQIYHQLAKMALYWFMSSTSINGLLQRGSMFVFSEKQFDQLLDISSSWKAEKLLDLGAGDGMVTQHMAHHFEQVYATEMSTTMQWRLQEKGYKVLGVEEWNNGTQLYDVIACLNLLDRCDKPVTLLHDMKRMVKPGTGRIVVALVLPFKPYVEFKRDHSPEQNILIEGVGFEDQVTSFIRDVFEPAGLSVTAFSRLPYLCEGDLQHSYYELNDAVFVLKVNE